MKASILNIADMAGVSIATVSRVLNNVGQVSEETRRAVLGAVKEANYVPRGSGRGKKKLQVGVGSGTLELIFCFNMEPEEIRPGAEGVELGRRVIRRPRELLEGEGRFESSFYRQISEGVIDEARSYGYKTVTHCIDKAELCDPELAEMLISDGVDGLLLAGEHPSGLHEFISRCPVPVVLVDMVADEGVVSVTTDNCKGISDAFDYIFDLGHRKIGFVVGCSIPEYSERYDAFAMRMARHGLELVEEWVYRGDNKVGAIGEWSEGILSGVSRPTAFLASNDFGALGVLRGATRSGLRVPGDLSIIGFDDIEMSSLVSPSITSVRVPKADIGRVSVRELLLGLSAPRENPEDGYSIRLRPRLIERESAVAVPQA